MRHKKLRYRLSRNISQRKAILRLLVQNLILNKDIRTTRAKAKAASRLMERLVSISKRDDIASRRYAYSILCNRNLVSILFNEIAPLFKERKSGFTRIMLLQKRTGDNAQMVILEFVEKPKPIVKEKKRTKAIPIVSEPKKESAEPEHPPITKMEPKLKEIKTQKPKPGLFKRAFTEGLRKFFRRRGEK